MFFVTSPDEIDALYAAVSSGSINNPSVWACGLPGVAAARQYALEHSPTDKIIMFDDDLRFAKRPPDWDPDVNYNLQSIHGDELIPMLTWMATALDDYAAVGLWARGNNRGEKRNEPVEGKRMMRAFGIDRAVLKDEGIRFDKFPYWEDFHVTLELLKRGYPNLIHPGFTNDGITNSEGGVSLYRNVEALRKVREEFMAYHAPFVVPNDNKQSQGWGQGGGLDGEAPPDIKVFWVKALEYGLSQLK